MDDFATVAEDILTVATGNVLDNDSDVDRETVLAVGNAGTYGRLELAVDGSYTYTLDNASDAVQALAQGQSVQDVFAYEATDGMAVTAGALTVAVSGRNDAPVVAHPIPDQEAEAGSPFTFTFEADAFADIDQGDVLAYSATLADGSALPEWLAFDGTTRTFSGTPPGSGAGECGCEGGASPASLEIRIHATDGHSATAFDDFVLNIAGGGGAGGGQTIIGTDANDLLMGTACDDVIDGRRGYDVMMGGNTSTRPVHPRSMATMGTRASATARIRRLRGTTTTRTMATELLQAIPAAGAASMATAGATTITTTTTVAKAGNASWTLSSSRPGRATTSSMRARTTRSRTTSRSSACWEAPTWMPRATARPTSWWATAATIY
jgi:VCBS repeat-containing protein